MFTSNQNMNAEQHCHRQLKGPIVHVYKEGRLYLKTSILRIRRPCTVCIRGTKLTISEASQGKSRIFDLNHARLAVQRATLRIILTITLDQKAKISLYAANERELEEWTEIFADSIHWRIQRFYNIEEELGKGAFSIVRKGTHKATGDTVAVKIMNKLICSAEDFRYLQREVDIAQILCHPNIVKFSDLFESEQSLYIVQEYISGGTLQHFIDTHGFVNESVARVIMTDILKAVEYMHSVSVAHRDIKPDNMLCTSSEFPFQVKVMDFGLARHTGTRNNSMSSDEIEHDHEGIGPDGLMTTPVGTPSYVAPEILMGLPYGFEIDLFACGIVLYLLLCGYLPFAHKDPVRLMELIKKTEFCFPGVEWMDVSEDAKSLVKKLLDRSPCARLSATEALSHPWFNDHIDSPRSVIDSQEFRVTPYNPPQSRDKESWNHGTGKIRTGLQKIQKAFSSSPISRNSISGQKLQCSASLPQS